MIYLVILLAAGSVGLLAFGIAHLTSTGESVVSQRIAALETGPRAETQVRGRGEREGHRRRIHDLLEGLGDRLVPDEDHIPAIRRRLVRAGYRQERSLRFYYAGRLVLAGLLPLAAFVAGGYYLSVLQTAMLAAAGAALGWYLPRLYLDRQIRRRQKEIQRALPDALDLLIVCVEAGLGLNQALVRVSKEMERISPEMSDELRVVGLEIHAGTPRPDALKNLGRRTGLSDVRALVTMLIQTDRFGTSIANALRVHSETLRDLRRQRIEEAAAKTPVKMLFPLVFFIFPAILVVVLGPAAIHLIRMFGKM